MLKSGYDVASLARSIKAWGREFGFQNVGIADTDLSSAETHLATWLDKGWHGEMDYMARHGTRRTRPAELVPGTLRVIACRMNYAADLEDGWAALADGERAYVARYARGRDYHKVLRSRLQRLADRIADEVGDFGHRVFTDSAPVMEVELAAEGRPRLARQAHAAAHARSGVVLLSRRDLHRPSAAGGRAGSESLRQLHEMHRALPHAGDPRPVQPRRAALHLLPHDRAQGFDPGRVAAR